MKAKKKKSAESETSAQTFIIVWINWKHAVCAIVHSHSIAMYKNVICANKIGFIWLCCCCCCCRSLSIIIILSIKFFVVVANNRCLYLAFCVHVCVIESVIFVRHNWLICICKKKHIQQQQIVVSHMLVPILIERLFSLLCHSLIATKRKKNTEYSRQIWFISTEIGRPSQTI